MMLYTNLITFFLKIQGDPPDVFTIKTLGTIGGAAFAIMVLTKTIKFFFPNIGKTLFIIVLIASFLLSGLMVFNQEASQEPGFPSTRIILIFFNGLLLFTTSIGANESLSGFTNNSPDHAGDRTRSNQGLAKRILASWFS